MNCTVIAGSSDPVPNSMAKRIRYKTEHRIHYVTSSVHKHLPVFDNHKCASELFSILGFYRNNNRFRLYGYVIMPNHFHLLLEIAENDEISSLMRDIKKYYSYRFKTVLCRELGYPLSNFRKDDSYHFWETGFDEVTIINEKTFYSKLNYIHNNPVRAGLSDSPQEYPYSSAPFYFGKSKPIFPIDAI